MLQQLSRQSFTLSGRCNSFEDRPDNKVHGTNMGGIWGRQDPGGPHVGPKNFAIWARGYP